MALVGPSGSGKTTVLRAIAGLERPEAGRIALGERVWFDAGRRVHLAPDRRSVGMVFQDHALFPHLSVAANVAFGTRDADRVGDLLGRLRVAHLADARPAALSGGERQRVALARALARDPAVLLLDEPMSALDAHTRAGVRRELRGILRDAGLPTLVVSHDVEDAAALADRVVVMEAGAVEQEGTPADLVARPANAFVAALTGALLLPGTATPDPGGTRVTLDAGGTVRSPDPGAGRVGVVVHPRRIRVAVAGTPAGGANAVAGTVGAVTDLGHAVRIEVGPLVAEVDPGDRPPLGPGAPAVAVFAVADTRLVPLPPDAPRLPPPGRAA